METTILTQKIGAGHYEVTVIQNYAEIGSFETTDMQLVDDIEDMRDYGFEENLQMHDTFEEVVGTCLNKIKE